MFCYALGMEEVNKSTCFLHLACCKKITNPSLDSVPWIYRICQIQRCPQVQFVYYLSKKKENVESATSAIRVVHEVAFCVHYICNPPPPTKKLKQISSYLSHYLGLRVQVLKPETFQSSIPVTSSLFVSLFATKNLLNYSCALF